VGGSSGIVGVSGGERRRVSIALELCARPQVLLMDEVTSGLDSYTAHKLVTMLKQIARDHHRIMITAIHQPSQAIYAQMDRLLLLAQGRAVFSGPAEHVEQLLINARVPRPAHVPMADFLLELVNEPQQMRAVIKYSSATPDAKGYDIGEDAAVWIRAKIKSRRVPLLYRLGILVRTGHAVPPCAVIRRWRATEILPPQAVSDLCACRCGVLCWTCRAT
jgi:ABC-type multidrug transport system ATPase subunit